MNLKTIAMVFGVVLLAIGVLGFVPGLTPDGLLLGIFEVDFLHNIVHIVTGAAAIAASMAGADYSRTFFQIFGVIYGIVTLSGFLTGHGLIALIPVNMADNLLHVSITALSLYLGFASPKETVKA